MACGPEIPQNLIDARVAATAKPPTSERELLERMESRLAALEDSMQALVLAAFKLEVALKAIAYRFDNSKLVRFVRGPKKG